MGERLSLKQPHAGRRWWLEVQPSISASFLGNADNSPRNAFQ